MYFKNFPRLYYPFYVKGEDTFALVKDITINVRFVKEFLSNITLYDYYDIKDGETPEILSERFYDTPMYHWIIMLVNERYDYINDFPLPYPELQRYVEDKYGAENIYNTHHYENAQGYVVNDDYPLATPISNLLYEERINEEKRQIKIVDKRIIEQVASEFYSSVTS